MTDAESNLRKELSDKIKAYESKIATLTIIHGAVQKENEKLRNELKQAQQPASLAEEELLELKEEFSRRLGSADQTIARLQDEKERLKGQVAAANQGTTANSAQLQDKHTFIASLQEEGLGLAKRNSELEAAARKLRAAARDSEAEHQRLLSKVQNLEVQVAREQDRYAQASQAAGEQMEELEGQLEATTADSERQVAEAQQQASEAIRKAQAMAARGDAEAVALSLERETLMSRNLAELRSDMEAAEQRWGEREGMLRREVGRLQDQIHALESEKAELAVSASEATRPLLRQIESMAAAAAEQQRSAQDSELSFTARLKQAESAQAAASEAARSAGSQAQKAEAAASIAKQGLSKAQALLQESKIKHHAEQQRCAKLQEERAKAQTQHKTAVAAAQTAQTDYERKHLNMQTQIQALQQQLNDSRADHQQMQESHTNSESLPGSISHSSHPVSRPSVLNGVKAMLQKLNGTQNQHTLLPISVPSLVIGQQQGADTPPCSAHVASSSAAVFQHNSDGILHQPQGTSQVSRGSSEQEADQGIPGGDMAGTSGKEEDEWDSLLRSMSRGRHPKGKNGASEAARIANLQRRLRSSEAAEQRVHTELLKACERAEAAERDAAKPQQLQEYIQEQEQKYGTALELLGERNERVDQLEEDIVEMKQIFHEQISMMADQLNKVGQATL